MAAIGVVRLAPGQVGYFDELTRIHLTISNSEKTVFEGSNLSNIKKAIKSGRLVLVSGTLDPETNIQPEVVVKPAKPVEQPKEEIIVDTEEAEIKTDEVEPQGEAVVAEVTLDAAQEEAEVVDEVQDVQEPKQEVQAEEGQKTTAKKPAGKKKSTAKK